MVQNSVIKQLSHYTHWHPDEGVGGLCSHRCCSSCDFAAPEAIVCTSLFTVKVMACITYTDTKIQRYTGIHKVQKWIYLLFSVFVCAYVCVWCVCIYVCVVCMCRYVYVCVWCVCMGTCVLQYESQRIISRSQSFPYTTGSRGQTQTIRIVCQAFSCLVILLNH